MTDFAPNLERAFPDRFEEGAYQVEDVSGTVPGWLRGTYYLNGPALFRRDHRSYRHWLDGDGMVCALRFGDDGIRFTNRYVRSEKFKSEEQADKLVYRAFGTAFEDDRLVRGIGLASPVNVSVYRIGQRLLACGEQGLPYELDPETLETLGVFDFEHRLNPISPFGAHMHFDPALGSRETSSGDHINGGEPEVLAFGVSFSASHPAINLYRFTDNAELIARNRVPLDQPVSIHDFALSRGHAVFYVTPYRLDMSLLQGGKTVMQALSWQEETNSYLLAIDRETSDPIRVDLGRGYCLHLINAFQKKGKLTVDVIEYQRPLYQHYQVLPELFADVGLGRPVRYRIDLENACVVERLEHGHVSSPDFPVIDPALGTRPCQQAWMLGMSAAGKAGRKYFDQLVQIDWESRDTTVFQCPAGSYFAGEPGYLPAAEPRDSLLLCPRFDAERVETAFWLFRARHIDSGPIATLRLRSPIQLGFHSQFAPQ